MCPTSVKTDLKDRSLLLASAAIALKNAPPTLKDAASEVFVSILADWAMSGGGTFPSLSRGVVKLIELHIRSMLADPQKAAIARLGGAMVGLYGDAPELLSDVWESMSASERERLRLILAKLENRRLERLPPHIWLVATRLTGLALLPDTAIPLRRLVELFSLLSDEEVCARIGYVNLSRTVSDHTQGGEDEIAFARERAQAAAPLARAFISLLIGLYLGAKDPREPFEAYETIARAVLAHPEWENRAHALRWLADIAQAMAESIHRANIPVEFNNILSTHELFAQFAFHRSAMDRAYYLTEYLLKYARGCCSELSEGELPPEASDFPFVIGLARRHFSSELNASTFLTLTRRLSDGQHAEIYDTLATSNLSDALGLPPDSLTPTQRGVLFAYAAADPKTDEAEGEAILKRMLGGLSDSELGESARAIKFVLRSAFNTIYTSSIISNRLVQENCLAKFISLSWTDRYGFVRDLFNRHAREVGSLHRVAVSQIERSRPVVERTVKDLPSETRDFHPDPFVIGVGISTSRFAPAIRRVFSAETSNGEREALFRKLPPRWGLFALLLAHGWGIRGIETRNLTAIVAEGLDEDDKELLKRVTQPDSPPSLLPLYEEIALRLRTIDILRFAPNLPSWRSIHPGLPSKAAELALSMAQGDGDIHQIGDEKMRAVAYKLAECYEALKRRHLPVDLGIGRAIALPTLSQRSSAQKGTAQSAY